MKDLFFAGQQFKCIIINKKKKCEKNNQINYCQRVEAKKWKQYFIWPSLSFVEMAMLVFHFHGILHFATAWVWIFILFFSFIFFFIFIIFGQFSFSPFFCCNESDYKPTAKQTIIRGRGGGLVCGKAISFAFPLPPPLL